MFEDALEKFTKHYDDLPAGGIYRECWVFDPNQAPGMTSDLSKCSSLATKVVTNCENEKEAELLRQ